MVCIFSIFLHFSNNYQTFSPNNKKKNKNYPNLLPLPDSGPHPSVNKEREGGRFPCSAARARQGRRAAWRGGGGGAAASGGRPAMRPGWTAARAARRSGVHAGQAQGRMGRLRMVRRRPWRPRRRRSGPGGHGARRLRSGAARWPERAGGPGARGGAVLGRVSVARNGGGDWSS